MSSPVADYEFASPCPKCGKEVRSMISGAPSFFSKSQLFPCGHQIPTISVEINVVKEQRCNLGKVHDSFILVRFQPVDSSSNET